jgi:hypothetical protein
MVFEVGLYVLLIYFMILLLKSTLVDSNPKLHPSTTGIINSLLHWNKKEIEKGIWIRIRILKLRQMVYRFALTEAQFMAKLASLKGSRDPIYLLFMATRDETTGLRWCPDCRNAEPVLEEAFQSLPASATILEVLIPRESWKGPNGPKHPYRSAPFGVRGIPTLCLWNAVNEKVERKFTEGECEQIENLQELMSSHYWLRTANCVRSGLRFAKHLIDVFDVSQVGLYHKRVIDRTSLSPSSKVNDEIRVNADLRFFTSLNSKR